MARVISIHEYDLRPDVDQAAFERAIRNAEQRGLFSLTGLVEHHFLKGIKGARRGAFTAIWIFESREAWERLWGSLEPPRRPAEYPKTWVVWENEILMPLLTQSASPATKNCEIALRPPRAATVSSASR